MHTNDYVTSAYGVKMPKIIYGTAWKKDKTAGLVQLALEQGFRGIDTACQPKHYNEAGVGEGIAAGLDNGLQRSELYIQTKFTSLNGHDPLQIPYDSSAPLSIQVEQSFQKSLLNLKTRYLDGLVLHSPLPSQQQTMEVWRAMEKIFHADAVKQLGISNCYDVKLLETLYKSAEIKPAVIQNRFYADTDYDKDIRNFCKQKEIIYQSFWSLTANPRILANANLLALAEKYQRSPAQIFFRFLTQIGILPLTGTSSAEHMQEDLAIFNFELLTTEREALSGLL